MAQAAFGLATMTIAIPTGIKIFNWLGTMWLGRIRLPTPMLFAIGFVAMFTIGGLSGVTHAVVPSDWQQTDTYYIVAHFHYVLFGGAVFGIFGGLYYWFPKLTGRMMNERMGKIHFWLMFIGFNLTFGPMHWLGLQGMVRRTWQYAPETGSSSGTIVVTSGAFIIALSIAVLHGQLVTSAPHGQRPGMDPWDARTLEWSSPTRPRVQLRSGPGGARASTTSGIQNTTRTLKGRAVRKEDGRRDVATDRAPAAQPRVTDPSPQPFVLPGLLGGSGCR